MIPRIKLTNKIIIPKLKLIYVLKHCEECVDPKPGVNFASGQVVHCSLP